MRVIRIMVGPYLESAREILYSASSQDFVYCAEGMDKCRTHAHGRDRCENLVLSTGENTCISPLSGIPLSTGIAKAIPDRATGGAFVLCGNRGFGPYAKIYAAFRIPGSDDAFWLADRRGEGTRLFISGATDETAQASRRQFDVANVTFSPDGKRLAYSCTVFGGPPGKMESLIVDKT